MGSSSVICLLTDSPNACFWCFSAWVKSSSSLSNISIFEFMASCYAPATDQIKSKVNPLLFNLGQKKQTCSRYKAGFWRSHPACTVGRISVASCLGVENELESLNPSSVTVEDAWCELGKLPLGTLSQELAALSSMLRLLKVVRTENREGSRNDVLTDAGTTFSDIDLCTWPSTALLTYPFGCPPRSDKVDIELLVAGGVAALRDEGTQASLYKIEFRVNN